MRATTARAMVLEAIDDGVDENDKIAEWMGMSAKVVQNAITALRRDGVIEMATPSRSGTRGQRATWRRVSR